MAGDQEVIPFIKAHAYGNDFLFVDEAAVSADEASSVAQAICDRHAGVGADGLIFYRITATGAAMKLFNADGSVAEVSGNGVRCLAAIVANSDDDDADIGGETVIETEGGVKVLTLLDTKPPRHTFRAFMGQPTGLREVDLDVGGEQLSVIVLSVGNPQCIVLTDRLDETRFSRVGPLLATHAAFPEGTNVEFVQVEHPDRARILIWERTVRGDPVWVQRPLRAPVRAPPPWPRLSTVGQPALLTSCRWAGRSMSTGETTVSISRAGPK